MDGKRLGNDIKIQRESRENGERDRRQKDRKVETQEIRESKEQKGKGTEKETRLLKERQGIRGGRETERK